MNWLLEGVGGRGNSSYSPDPPWSHQRFVAPMKFLLLSLKLDLHAYYLAKLFRITSLDVRLYTIRAYERWLL